MPKSLRFEVFKRDKFACQYCGVKAPEAILHVDHLTPVSAGGQNELLNLITACNACNFGKGARLLDDQSLIENQRKQIEELQERREQLEMMLSWRDELSNFNKDIINIIVSHISDCSKYEPNEAGKAIIRKWIKSYPLKEILHAIDEAFDIYLEYENDTPTVTSWNKAFYKIPGIINVTRQSMEKPYLQKLFYIQGILRKRSRSKYLKCIEALESFVLEGLPTEELESIAKRSKNWDDFCQKAEAAIPLYIEEDK